MKTQIFFRTDGDNKTGMGHLVRSFSLAKMLQKDFDCTFIIKTAPATFVAMLQQESIGVIQLNQEKALHHEAQYLSAEVLTGQEIFVTDGYKFDTQYQQIIKNTGCQLVCIDDIHKVHFVADVVINHSSGISPEDYSAEAYTQFYLGFDYLLLRPAFFQKQSSHNSAGLRHAFVCMGGADPKNHIIEVLQHLEKIHWLRKCHVVIGSAYLHRTELETFCQKSPLAINIFENINAAQMAELMTVCGVAITPPSTVALEYLVTGQHLFLHQTADNQSFLKDYLIKNHVAFDLKDLPPSVDTFPVSNPEKRPDGASAKRLRRIFYDLEKDLHCQLRRAKASDMQTCYTWANDPETKKQSFRTHEISLEEHSNWFQRKINCSDTFYYILEYQGRAVGQIRFDLKKEAVLSYAIAATQRGKGFGTYLLKKGAERLQKDLKSKVTITGLVKSENAASNRTFTKLGYQKTSYKKAKNIFRYTLNPISIFAQ